MRWRRTLGRAVVNRDSGESIGGVDGFVLEPSTRRITAVVVGDQVVTWGDMGGIGPDAAVLPDLGNLRAPSSEQEARTIEDRIDPLGHDVFTEDGFKIGSLTDVDFDSETGDLRSLVLSDDEIGAVRLLGVGSYAVVISSRDRDPTDDDLDSLSKDELYERARVRDLEGRSSMTKRQLIEALSRT